MERAIEKALPYFQMLELRREDQLKKNLKKQKNLKDAVLSTSESLPKTFWRDPLGHTLLGLVKLKLSWIRHKAANEKARLIRCISAESALRQGNVYPAIDCLDNLLNEIPAELTEESYLSASGPERISRQNPVFLQILGIRNSLYELAGKQTSSKQA